MNLKDGKKLTISDCILVTEMNARTERQLQCLFWQKQHTENNKKRTSKGGRPVCPSKLNIEIPITNLNKGSAVQ